MSEIWTFTPDHKVLLTLRHPDKHYGNLWECTGSSAILGEDSLTAARRELHEETGLSMGDTIPTLLTTFTSHDTIYDVYAIRLNFTLDDIVLQDGETVDKRLVDFSFLENPANDSLLSPPPARRMRACLPLLRRFYEGGECWDMYDHNGKFLGYNRLRPKTSDEQIFSWEMSMAAFALLMDAQGRILLTQRAPHKTVGGEWGCTGGGVSSGESAQQALEREVYEEVGLDISACDLHPLARLHNDSANGAWCMCVYAIKLPFELNDLHLQTEEVTAAKLVTPEELLNYPLVNGIFKRTPSAMPELMALADA